MGRPSIEDTDEERDTGRLCRCRQRRQDGVRTVEEEAEEEERKKTRRAGEKERPQE